MSGDFQDVPTGADGPPGGRHARGPRRRWLHVLLLCLGVALIAVATLALAANDEWILVDRPGCVLKVRAANLGWHAAWVDVPNDPAEFVPSSLSGELREKYKYQLNVVGRWQRQSIRDNHVRWCDQQIQRNIGANSRAYAIDLWRGRVAALPGLDVPEPTVWIVGLPAWVFAVPGLILLLIPVLAVRRHRLRLRWQRYCRTCGYDLTGNTTGVCSECGAFLPADLSPPAAQGEEPSS
ncbi:MAG: hypothetical protein H6816_10425 [Phycisphaerales bacterium]|nr:hypothetical protein [Phycisphaerales bacterium]